MEWKLEMTHAVFAEGIKPDIILLNAKPVIGTKCQLVQLIFEYR